MLKKLIFLFLLMFCTTMAQGKIFTKENADELYGPVIDSVEIKTTDLMKMMDSTKTNIMFTVENSKMNILGDNRKPLLEEFAIKSSQVYHLFLKSTTLELLNLGGKDITYIEKRECVLSVTNGNYTMEISLPCPPYCN